ncbi:MAG TPA: HAD family hydrolase, partial [Bryobacteraceae bacterium]|nr:HAD family hydrolase [Bryobacteraceae bacterium]
MNIATLNRAIEEGTVKALVIDVDGTLYRQAPVRQRMLLRLLLQALVRPREMATVFRSLRAYRRAQETMRDTCAECASLYDEQIRVSANACGVPAAEVAKHVATWMEASPLDLLRAAMRQDVSACLQKARAKGLRLAVWSDYPAAGKLKALEMDGLFDVVVCAQDPDVQRFKPDPRGLEVALSKLGVA